MYNKYKQQLFELGYTVIPNMIHADKINDIRDSYLHLFEESNVSTLKPSEFLKYSTISDTIFNDNVMEAVSNVVGNNYCLYPDFTIRKNLYIPWHTDTSYLDINQTDSYEDSNFVQMSIYLQDNTLETGGGLEIITGSHRIKNINRKNLLNNNINFSNSSLMPSNSGDLVFWDSRLIHKSRENSLNAQCIKLAVQWTISQNEKFSQQYLQYLYDRINAYNTHVSDNIENNREMLYLNDIPNIQFPFSFTNHQIHKINKFNVNVKTL